MMNQSQTTGEISSDLQQDESAPRAEVANPLPWLIRNLLRKQCKAEQDNQDLTDEQATRRTS